MQSTFTSESNPFIRFQSTDVYKKCYHEYDDNNQTIHYTVVSFDLDLGLNATTTVSSILSNDTFRMRDPYARCPAYDKPLNVSTFVYLLSGPINLGTGIMGKPENQVKGYSYGGVP